MILKTHILDGHYRGKKAIFSAVEAEEIVEVTICLFLDRQLQGLLILLNDCMGAVVNYFTDQEWSTSCQNIAKFIGCRLLTLVFSFGFYVGKIIEY